MSLVKHVRPPSRRGYDYAFVATFNADLRFFERRIFGALRAQNVLCLLDGSQHRQLTEADGPSAAPKFAGIRYQVASVYARHGVFHPKFILWLAEGRSRLILGSSNLTQAGFMTNGEIVTIIEAQEDEPDEALALIDEACGFLDCLLQQDYLESSPGHEVIKQALGLRPRATPVIKRQNWLLHSLDGPLLDQIASHVGDQPVKEIHTLGPFLGEDETLFDEVSRRFNNPMLRIYLQQHMTQFPIQAMIRWHRRHPEARLVEVEIPDHDTADNRASSSRRYMHAKVVGLVTSKGTYVLTGSPNFSHAALTSNARDGNIEVALLTLLPNKTTLMQLLGPPFLQVREVKSWGSVKTSEEKGWTSTGGHQPALRITQARFAGNELTLDLAYSPGDLADLDKPLAFLMTPGGKRSSPIAADRIAKDRIVARCELAAIATLTWVQAIDRRDGRTLISDRHWVAFPQMFGLTETITVDDFQRCVEIGGLEGIREALNMARRLGEQPDWLIAFLQTWDLGTILAQDIRGKDVTKLVNLVSRQPASDLIVKHSNLQRGLLMLTHPDLEELMHTLVQSYRDRAIEWLEEAGAEAEDVQTGLQYVAVFNILCLLFMHSFITTIEFERDKMKEGLKYPQMQYGHVRQAAQDFVDYFQLDWASNLRLGDLAISALMIRHEKGPGHLPLFHYADMLIAYWLATSIASKLDLEKPIQFKPVTWVVNGLISGRPRDRALSWLNSSDGEEVLANTIANYGPVLEVTGLRITAEELRRDIFRILEQ